MASRTPARPERPSTSRFPAPIQSAGRIAVGVLIAALLLAAIPGGPARDRAEAAFPGRAVDWAPVTTGSPPLNLILLSLDTTRRDHLSCYGFSKPTTPNLDRLAAEGILFEDSFTPVPVTLAAHATMLTGLYPYQHGVRNNGSYVLPAKAVTLAEILKQRGYSTGAVLGAFPLDHRFGLDQGFDSYDDHFPPELRDADTAQRSGAEVSRLALEWLDSHKSGPFFLWAHYFDAHAPYRPIEPFKSRFPGDPYSAEVAAMDAAIGDLMSGLRTRGLLERTVIIVAGDHGEGLGEHNELTHTTFIYGATQQVPMLCRFPQAGPFGDKNWRARRITGLVDLTDLMPTALNALGLPESEVPGPFAGASASVSGSGAAGSGAAGSGAAGSGAAAAPGISLLPLIQGNGEPHERIYHESLVPDLEYGASELRGLQDERWMYIRAPRRELYDLKKDPGELNNLANSEKAQADKMEALLADLLRGESDTGAGKAMDQETAERLRSLGYIGAGGTPSTGPKPDPKDMQWVPRAIADAETRASLFRTESALRLVDSVLTVYPQVRTAQRLKATYLTRLGRGEEAIRAYDKAIADCRGCPDELRLMQERAMASMTAGKLDDALRRTRSLLEGHPKEQGLHLMLGEIYQAKGDVPNARAAYTKEAQLFPLEPLPLVELGNLEKDNKNYAAAEKAYRAALKIAPRNPNALVMLSELLDQTGRKAEAEPLADQALASDPLHPAAQFRKGQILARAGKPEEALKYYTAAVEAQPDNPVLLSALAEVYMKTGKNDLAVKSYQKSIATGRAGQDAYSNLGVLFAQSGRLKEAVAQWELGISRDPNGTAVPAMKKNLALARERMGAKK